MGRTLHFAVIKENGKFSTKDHQAMLDVSNKFNSGKFADIWTCENFYLSPYNFFPNWEHFKKVGVTTGEWDIVNKRYEELHNEGKGEIESCKQLHKEKLVHFQSDPKSNHIGGFCKVQGNEFNAAVVFTALVELSKKIKGAVIELSDEDRLLFCDVRIKSGKVQANLSSVREHIRDLATRIAMHKDTGIIAQLYKKGLPEGLVKDLELDGSPYSVESSIEYINESLSDLDELYAVLKDKIKSSYHCIHNIEQEWFEPHLFCRPVKAEDFKDFEGGAAKLMSGFYGEYWKLTDKDSEAESYRAIGMIQKMLGDKLKGQLKILPKIKG